MFDALSIKYFLVVARERSVNRAAKVLHASQPAVSRRIQQLECEVGAPLFERHSAGVALTRAGRALVRYADEISRLSDEARQVVRRVSGQPGKPVRIGFYQLTLAVLIPLLRQLQTEHPEIKVEPIQAGRAALLEGLRKDEIDLVLPDYVPLEMLAEFDGLRIAGPRSNFVLPKSHRFARRKRLELAELKDEVFVGFDEHEFPGVNTLLLHHCRLAGFVPQISVYARSWSEIMANVLAGNGIALAPRIAIALSLADTVSLIDAHHGPEWYALWNPNNGNLQLRVVIQMLLEAPPPGWSSVKRKLPPLGASHIRTTAEKADDSSGNC